MLRMGLAPKTQTISATVFIDRASDLNEMSSRILSIGGVISVKKLEKAWAIYIVASNTDVFRKISELQGVIEIKPGYEYGDAENINNYYNMEHPPLGKYILILSMLAIGDYPDGWRIPSMVSGALLTIVTGLIVRETTKRNIYAILASILTASDPIVRVMAGVAMLDIFLALFTALSIYFTIRESWTLSGIFLGLAISTKMSGGFVLIALLILAALRSRDIIRTYRDLILIPAAVFIIINLPIIILFGIQAWYDQSIVGAISWHLRTKTQPGEGPPVSAPWMWLYGENPFYLTVSPDTIARGNIYVYMGSIAMALIIIPAARSFPIISELTIATFVTWLGYVLIWLLGNHSQYSFYMVQLAPLFSALFISQLWVLFENTGAIISSYRSIYSRIRGNRGSQKAQGSSADDLNY